jgi:hypothetical protein
MQHLLTKLAAPLMGIAIGALPFGGASAQQSQPSNSTVPLTLAQRIPMPGVTGRMDHLGIAIGNSTRRQSSPCAEP